jgi:deoxycytidylate deaminase
MDNPYFKDSRPLRELLHMQTAMAWATRSLCKRLRVGTVITNWEMDEVLAFGYNGPGKGLDHDRCRRYQEGNCGCVHAESNAVAKCRTIAGEPGVLFCTTCPCERCAQLLVRKGIRKAIYLVRYRNPETESLLKQMKVEVIGMKVEFVMEGIAKIAQSSLMYDAWSGASSPSTLKPTDSGLTTGTDSSASLTSQIKASTDSFVSLPSPFGS